MNKLVKIFALFCFLVKDGYGIGPKLIIGIFEYPPQVITSGDFKGLGIHEKYNNFIIEKLSKNYKIEVDVYPKTRLIKNLVLKSNYCTNTIFKTP